MGAGQRNWDLICIMKTENEQRWREVGRKLTKAGAVTIGGYLEGGLIGAGASLLRAFLRDKKGIELPELVEEIDVVHVDEVISGLEPGEIQELRLADADVEKKEIEAAMAADANFTSRYEAELATGSKWLWLIRPGLTLFWTAVTLFFMWLTVYGSIPEGRETAVGQMVDLCIEITKWVVLFWFSSRGVEKVTRIATGQEKPLTTIIGGISEIIRRRRSKNTTDS